MMTRIIIISINMIIIKYFYKIEIASAVRDKNIKEWN